MKRIRELISKCTGFEWDSGNLLKNWFAHNVHYREIEQAIINRPIVLLEDMAHSQREERFSALGRTDVNRLLTVVFTIRGDRFRAATWTLRKKDCFMRKDIKPIPEFKNEDEEREFWGTHSTVDYFDVANAYRPTEPFENLKPSEDLLEFKMPIDDVKDLDLFAKKQNITRDVLARNVLLEWIRRQRDRARA